MCLCSENKCKIKHNKINFNAQRKKSDRNSVLECLLLPTGVIVPCAKHFAVCVYDVKYCHSMKRITPIGKEMKTDLESL